MGLDGFFKDVEQGMIGALLLLAIIGLLGAVTFFVLPYVF